MTNQIRKIKKYLMIIVSAIILSALIVVLVACNGGNNNGGGSGNVSAESILDSVTVQSTADGGVVVGWAKIANVPSYSITRNGQMIGGYINAIDETQTTLYDLDAQNEISINAKIGDSYVSVAKFSLQQQTESFALSGLSGKLEDNSVIISFDDNLSAGCSGYELSVLSSYLTVKSEVPEIKMAKNEISNRQIRIRAAKKPQIINEQKVFYFGGWSSIVKVKIVEEVNNIFYKDNGSILTWESQKTSASASADSFDIEIASDKKSELKTGVLSNSTGLDLSEYAGSDVTVTVIAKGTYNSVTRELSCESKSKPITIIYCPPVENLRLEYGILRWNSISGASSYSVSQTEYTSEKGVEVKKMVVSKSDAPYISGFSATTNYKVSVKPNMTTTNTYSVEQVFGWFAVLPSPDIKEKAINVNESTFKAVWSNVDNAAQYGFACYLDNVRYDIKDSTGNFDLSKLSSNMLTSLSVKEGAAKVVDPGHYVISLYSLPNDGAYKVVNTSKDIFNVFLYPSSPTSFDFYKLPAPTLNYEKNSDGTAITFNINRGDYQGEYSVRIGAENYAIATNGSSFVVKNDKINQGGTLSVSCCATDPDKNTKKMNSEPWLATFEIADTIGDNEISLSIDELGEYYVALPSRMHTCTLFVNNEEKQMVATLTNNHPRIYLSEFADEIKSNSVCSYRVEAYNTSNAENCFSSRTTWITFEKLSNAYNISVSNNLSISWSTSNAGLLSGYRVQVDQTVSNATSTNFKLSELKVGDTEVSITCLAISTNNYHYYMNSDPESITLTKLARPDLSIKDSILNWKAVDKANAYEFSARIGDAEVFPTVVLTKETLSATLFDRLADVGSTSRDVTITLGVSCLAPNVDNINRRVFPSDKTEINIIKLRTPTIYMKNSIINDSLGNDNVFAFSMDDAYQLSALTFNPDPQGVLAAGAHSVYCYNKGDGETSLDSKVSNTVLFTKLKQAKLSFGATSEPEALTRSYFITLESDDEVAQGELISFDNGTYIDSSNILDNYVYNVPNTTLSGNHSFGVVRVGNGETTINSTATVLNYSKQPKPVDLKLTQGLLDWYNGEAFETKLVFYKPDNADVKDQMTLSAAQRNIHNPEAIQYAKIGSWVDGYVSFMVYRLGEVNDNVMDSDMTDPFTVLKLEAPQLVFAHQKGDLSAAFTWDALKDVTYSIKVDSQVTRQQTGYWNIFNSSAGSHDFEVIALGEDSKATINSNLVKTDFKKISTPTLIFSADGGEHLYWEPFISDVEYYYSFATRANNSVAYDDVNSIFGIATENSIDMTDILSSPIDVSVSMIAYGDPNKRVVGSGRFDINVIRLQNPSLEISLENLLITSSEYQPFESYMMLVEGSRYITTNSVVSWNEIDMSVAGKTYNIDVVCMGNGKNSGTVVLPSIVSQTQVIRPESPSNLRLVDNIKFAFDSVKNASGYKVQILNSHNNSVFDDIIQETSLNLGLIREIAESNEIFRLSIVTQGDLNNGIINSRAENFVIVKQGSPTLSISLSDEKLHWVGPADTDYYIVTNTRNEVVETTDQEFVLDIEEGEYVTYSVCAVARDKLISIPTEFTVTRQFTPNCANIGKKFNWAISSNVPQYLWYLTVPGGAFGGNQGFADELNGYYSLDLSNEIQKQGVYEFELTALGDAELGRLSSRPFVKSLTVIDTPQFTWDLSGTIQYTIPYETMSYQYKVSREGNVLSVVNNVVSTQDYGETATLNVNDIHNVFLREGSYSIEFTFFADETDYISTMPTSMNFVILGEVDPEIDTTTQMLTWKHIENAQGYHIDIYNGETDELYRSYDITEVALNLASINISSLRIVIYAKGKISSTLAILDSVVVSFQYNK